MSEPLPWGRARIEALIPHRDPFLFVDEVVACDEAKLAASWRIPADADWFRGHYPGQPVQPGVLICEHAFQVAALLIAAQSDGIDARDGVPVLTKIERARFRRMVGPGELLETTVEVAERVGPAWILSSRTRCEGDKVLEARFVLSGTTAMARIEQP